MKFISMSLLAVSLSACMVGPDFHQPQSPQTKSYTKQPLPKRTASASSRSNVGSAQVFMPNKTLPKDWWALFHSKAINHLVQQALANNQDYLQAQETLKRAQRLLRAQSGKLLFPQVDLNLLGERTKTSGLSFGSQSPGNYFTLYGSQVQVSYLLDVFGGARRQLEAMSAEVNQTYFDTMGVYLTLTANVVTTAVNVASLKAQLVATRQLINAAQNMVDVMRKQLRLGGISQEDLLLQQTQLAQTQATLPPLENQLAESQHALAVLIGQLPSQADLPALQLSAMHLPKYLPVSVPSQLTKQRPDIQQASAFLHQASAEVGVATANLFPQITLNGSYGWLAQAPNELFNPTTNLWSIALGLLQPVFHGGELLAKRDAAKDAFVAALANYRQVVLNGFKNVADSLRSVQSSAALYKAQIFAESSAYASYKMAKGSYTLGGNNYLTVLTAEEKYQQTKLNRIKAQASRYTSTVSLFQSLGGGWWQATSKVVKSVRKGRCCKQHSIKRSKKT